NRFLQSLDIDRHVLARCGGEPSHEVPIRLTDSVGASCGGGLADAGAIGVAVRLCRRELQARVLRLPFVLEVLLIDPVAVLRALCRRSVVPDRSEQDRERGETLLTVDDEIPMHARRSVRGRWREDDRTEEVGRLPVDLPVLRKEDEIAPQALVLVLLPRIGALVQRHLVLLRSFEQLLQRRLRHLHPLDTSLSRWCLQYSRSRLDAKRPDCTFSITASTDPELRPRSPEYRSPRSGASLPGSWRSLPGGA